MYFINKINDYPTFKMTTDDIQQVSKQFLHSHNLYNYLSFVNILQMLNINCSTHACIIVQN